MTIWQGYLLVAVAATLIAGLATNWVGALIVAIVFAVGFLPFWGVVTIVRPMTDKPHIQSPDD